MKKHFRLPSPATAIAAFALFVALSGTAVAAGIVAKAKFALNAGKLQGQTAAQVAGLPSPASSAASLVTAKTASFSINGQAAKTVAVACDSGQKAISGGFSSPQLVLLSDTAPSGDGSSWQVFLVNLDSSTASGTAYALCLK
jgi:hypothetical protein